MNVAAPTSVPGRAPGAFLSMQHLRRTGPAHHGGFPARSASNSWPDLGVGGEEAEYCDASVLS